MMDMGALCFTSPAQSSVCCGRRAWAKSPRLSAALPSSLAASAGDSSATRGGARGGAGAACMRVKAACALSALRLRAFCAAASCARAPPPRSTSACRVDGRGVAPPMEDAAPTGVPPWQEHMTADYCARPQEQPSRARSAHKRGQGAAVRAARAFTHAAELATSPSVKSRRSNSRSLSRTRARKASPRTCAPQRRASRPADGRARGRADAVRTPSRLAAGSAASGAPACAGGAPAAGANSWMHRPSEV